MNAIEEETQAHELLGEYVQLHFAVPTADCSACAGYVVDWRVDQYGNLQFVKIRRANDGRNVWVNMACVAYWWNPLGPEA